MNRYLLSRLRFCPPAALLVLLCSCHGSNSPTPVSPPPPPTPSFTLTVSPGSLSIPAGGGGYATVTVSRSGGFADAVTLTLDGAPLGVLGSGTVAATAQTAQLSILVAREVAPQSLDTLRVKGTAGSLSQTGTFRLVIAPSLPMGQIRPDGVQASGGLQRAGSLENTGLAGEPVSSITSKNSSGTVEVRHGFRPSSQPN